MNNYSNRIPNEEVRAEMRAKAFEMRLANRPWKEVAEALGVSRPTATKLVEEYKEALLTPQAEQLRKVENEKLDRIEALAWRLLEDNHVAFQHGKVVTLDGKPIEDTEPIFKGINSVLKVAERRAKLWGLDTPVKTEHVVTTKSPIDASVMDLVAQMEAQAAAEQKALSTD